jgi:hypothetical protein
VTGEVRAALGLEEVQVEEAQDWKQFGSKPSQGLLVKEI